jgi:hypothetical protein
MARGTQIILSARYGRQCRLVGTSARTAAPRAFSLAFCITQCDGVCRAPTRFWISAAVGTVINLVVLGSDAAAWRRGVLPAPVGCCLWLLRAHREGMPKFGLRSDGLMLKPPPTVRIVDAVASDPCAAADNGSGVPLTGV